MNPLETIEITCPYCGSRIEITVDTSASRQAYVEDCQVCCQPIHVRITIEDGAVTAQVSTESG
jgi:transcription elongation factor Elf1